jgi:hypothetical protein
VYDGYIVVGTTTMKDVASSTEKTPSHALAACLRLHCSSCCRTLLHPND